MTAAKPIDVEAERTANRELFKRLKERDERAFEQLYIKYRKALINFAVLTLYSYADAEEIVHDLFVNIWANRKESSIPDNVAAYLFSAVRNRAANKIRQRSTIANVELDYSPDVAGLSMGSPAIEPDASVENAELSVALNQAIASLSAQRREVAVLRWLHHMSLDEIANIVGSSPKAVSMQLARTREQLAPLLERFK